MTPFWPTGQDVAATGDLSALHDVVLPAPVPTGPVAPGWALVWPALAIFFVVLTVQCWRRHRALAYRREALVACARLRGSGLSAELPVLLKSVALRAFPRKRVASLSGPAWSRFLDETGGGGCFGAGAGKDLSRAAYGRGSEVRDAAALFDAAEAWIRARGPAS